MVAEILAEILNGSYRDDVESGPSHVVFNADD
jgi:hypothetical protein